MAYKRTKKQRVERTFDLKSSIFSHWAVNVEEFFAKCFAADMQYSKIKKFLKEGSEQYK